MGMLVYRKKHYRTYLCGRDRYVVHNRLKPFKEGHTHIGNFDTAKYIIKLALRQEIPYHISDYLLESLVRISTDHGYIEALQMQLEVQRRKRE